MLGLLQNAVELLAAPIAGGFNDVPGGLGINASP